MGWAGLVITDRYAELYMRGIGVISVEKLREFHDGAYADGEWPLLDKFLLAGGHPMLPAHVYLWVSVLLAANGAFLVWRFFKVPKLPAGKPGDEQGSGVNRRVLRAAGVTNLLLAVLLFLGIRVALNWNRMDITDRYSELYNAGVFSADKLREFHDGAYADGEFTLLDNFLLAGGYKRLRERTSTFFSLLVAANGMFLVWKSFRMPKVPVEAQGST
jgi:hypothetical protein